MGETPLEASILDSGNGLYPLREFADRGGSTLEPSKEVLGTPSVEVSDWEETPLEAGTT